MSKKLATIEEMKEEAIKRMKLLNIKAQIIEDFKKGIKHNIKLFTGYTDDEPPEYIGMIQDDPQDEEDKTAEELAVKYIYNLTKKKPLIYYQMENTTPDGDNLKSFLYISKDREEWNIDEEDTAELIQLAMIITNNAINNGLSELGYIGMKNLKGYLYREY